MASMKAPRSQVGSADWISEERKAALQIAQSEVEEFSYSARNELDWLNEHMAGIFNENETNFAEVFKTPGKLRGKTPRTVQKPTRLESRVPLSEVFSTTPNGESSPASRLQSPRPNEHAPIGSPSIRPSASRLVVFSPKQAAQGNQDSGYFGSQDVAPLDIHMDTDSEELQTSPKLNSRCGAKFPLESGLKRAVIANNLEKTSQIAKEEQNLRASAEANKPSAMDTQFDPANISEFGDVESPERQLSLEAKQTVKVVDDARSVSDASSPIRPIVRKSSLNFASLPAREPLTAGKSNGARISRTSHYNRPTGDKSIGGTLVKQDREDARNIDKDMDDATDSQPTKSEDTKTYTQRLQDQINLLGQSQAKYLMQQNKTPAPKAVSPILLNTIQSTPGAFPEDDDDDWIAPPATVGVANEERPSLPKSHSADVMEGIQGKRTIGEPDFAISDDEDMDGALLEPHHQATNVKSADGHSKTVSASVIPNVHSAMGEGYALKNVVSTSNTSLLTITEAGDLGIPPKSPSRSFRESPLKQVKNKLSSILKSSRGLLASSAAISAEGKSLMSPSSTRLALHSVMSSESVATHQKVRSQAPQGLVAEVESSPTRSTRRTRASTEKEDKKREREAKRLEEQNEKLEKAREKEREKARVFSIEQERVAAMEKQIAAKKDEARSLAIETPKPTRTGLRNMTAVNGNVTMDDAATIPVAPIPRSLGPAHATRNKEAKRPAKPTREPQNRPKQAPTVIRVNTGSQSSQYRLSTAQPEVANHTAIQAHQLSNKASKASLQTKPSTQSLRGAAASRARAQELASKKKEQEEREAQRRRDAKVETEKRRVALQEEQRRQELLKRQEVERQRQQEQATSQVQTKNSVQRKAALEKAKQTRAPPPAVRSQGNGPPDFQLPQENLAVRPPSRMTSNANWGQEETKRPVNPVRSDASKAGTKRAFAQDKGDDGQVMRPPSWGGLTYQANEAKRRRTSEAFDDDADTSAQRNIKGPPVRPSAGFKKEMPTKSVFQNGYANATQSSAPNLFKATVTSQHASHMKAAHPLELAQISKGAIPFQPTSSATGPAYKTPARPGPVVAAKSAAKSATRSSPRFQNGEAIELPEIQTDDDSEDDEANGVAVAPWADSPDLRRALVRQETIDPSQIFGPPAPLNMEEVFNKSKDKFSKFRARTSSANWSGADRLTEEDIRKDLIARDKLRRDGGWSYEMSRDML